MASSTTLSETKVTSLHWKHIIEQLDSRELLPHRLRVDALIFLARALAMYRTDSPYAGEMKAVRDLMLCWIERLLVAQGLARIHVFRQHARELLPQLTDELEHWICQALLSRQIGYPLTHANLKILFLEAFSEIEHPTLVPQVTPS